MKIAFPAPLLGDLQGMLLERQDVESCVIGFAHAGDDRLIVAEQGSVPASAYVERTRVSAVFSPEYLLDVCNRARAAKCSLVLAHSHPDDGGRPGFSTADDAGEARLLPFLSARAPGTHTAMVISPAGLRARLLGTGEEIDVAEVGAKLQTFGAADGNAAFDDRFDRQSRAFGREGQQQIAKLTVAVVGTGGTGSVTCQQLAHLGVSRFLLIDFDRIEETNLNRVVGATADDVGKFKTDVVRRSIKAVNPAAEIKTIIGDVADDHIARELLAADLIFICTDSHASRAIINQIAYQHLIPTIDMGVSLSVRDGRLAYITGRVQLLAPGLPCLTCLDLLNSETIRREMMTPEARAADRYITGAQEPQPGVISLNSTVASLAITMFLGVVTDAPVRARNQIYDGVSGTLKNFTGQTDPQCFVCSHHGAFAKGDGWSLPTRKP